MLSQPPQFEKCPKHPTNDIVLFCLSLECKEPLCKDCCKLHVHWHNQQGTQANLDTVDNVRQTLLNEVHKQKIRFEEERAILHHFSDSEGSDFLKQVQTKLQKIKQTLLNSVNEYCHQLEEQIKQKILIHKQSHPGEKKELHHKLNTLIQHLDQQEKLLQQPKYIKGCLSVMSDELNIDFDQLTEEVDNSLKAYLSNAFDVYIYEERLPKIFQSYHEYVDVREANLGDELDLYTKRVRDNRKYNGNPNYTQQPTQSPKQFIQTQQKQLSSIYDEPKYRTTGFQRVQSGQQIQPIQSKISEDKFYKFYH